MGGRKKACIIFPFKHGVFCNITVFTWVILYQTPPSDLEDLNFVEPVCSVFTCCCFCHLLPFPVVAGFSFAFDLLVLSFFLLFFLWLLCFFDAPLFCACVYFSLLKVVGELQNEPKKFENHSFKLEFILKLKKTTIKEYDNFFFLYVLKSVK